MGRIAGRIQVTVNGVTVRGAGAFNINPGVDKNEMMVGVSGVDGHSSNPQAASIEGPVRWDEVTDIVKILKTAGVTVVIRCANGKTASMKDAVNTTDGQISLADATCPVNFQAARMRIY